MIFLDFLWNIVQNIYLLSKIGFLTILFVQNYYPIIQVRLGEVRLPTLIIFYLILKAAHMGQTGSGYYLEGRG